jgi:hypothetical protein
MSAADELERMAEEFHKRARWHFASDDNFVGGALMAVVDGMQQRAAELRAAAPTEWSGASGSVSVGADGSLEFRRPDGSKMGDLGEGLPLLIDCAVALLRERASELRASEASVSRIADRFDAADPKWHRLYAELRRRYPGALPKPDHVEVRQWWSCDDLCRGAPNRVVWYDEHEVDACVLKGDGYEVGANGRDMLTDPRWRYLGSGERSNLGISEVAGE